MMFELMQRSAQVDRDLVEVRRALAARRLPSAQERPRPPLLCLCGAPLLAGCAGVLLWFAAGASSGADRGVATLSLLAAAAAGYGSYRLARLALPFLRAPFGVGHRLQMQERALMYEAEWIRSGNARLGPTGYAEPIDPTAAPRLRRTGSRS